MLYFAYGSNLNRAHMAGRCPAAVALCKFMLPDARLVFRGVADVTDEPGIECPGGIWRITAACERALDRYEGCYGNNQSLYRKVYLPVIGAGEDTEMMMYVMNSTGLMPPNEYYLDVIKEGYRDFGLPLEPLYAAVQHSWDNKDKTRAERARRYRDGYPPLACVKTGRGDRRTTKGRRKRRTRK